MIDMYNIDTGSVELPTIKRTTVNINARIIKAETKNQNIDTTLAPLVEPEVDKGNG
jgi:hypothetical protein